MAGGFQDGVGETTCEGWVLVFCRRMVMGRRRRIWRIASAMVDPLAARWGFGHQFFDGFIIYSSGGSSVAQREGGGRRGGINSLLVKREMALKLVVEAMAGKMKEMAGQCWWICWLLRWKPAATTLLIFRERTEKRQIEKEERGKAFGGIRLPLW